MDLNSIKEIDDESSVSRIGAWRNKYFFIKNKPTTIQFY